MAFSDTTYNKRIIKEGIMPVKVTITDTCDVGDLIGYDAITTSAWERADANAKVPANLIAGAQAESGDEITCFRMAVIDFGSESTATAGDMVYTSDTEGAYASTPGNWVHQCVGQCVDATVAFICPSAIPLMGYSTSGTGHGAFIRAELESGRTASTATGGFSGMRVDVKTIATATVGAADIYGIYVFGQLQATGQTGTGSMLRLEDGCSSACGFDHYISLVTSNTDPPDYFLDLNVSSPTNSPWDVATAASGSITGNMKVKTPSGDRYLALYSAA